MIWRQGVWWPISAWPDSSDDDQALARLLEDIKTNAGIRPDGEIFLRGPRRRLDDGEQADQSDLMQDSGGSAAADLGVGVDEIGLDEMLDEHLNAYVRSDSGGREILETLLGGSLQDLSIKSLEDALAFLDESGNSYIVQSIARDHWWTLVRGGGGSWYEVDSLSTGPRALDSGGLAVWWQMASIEYPDLLVFDAPLVEEFTEQAAPADDEGAEQECEDGGTSALGLSLWQHLGQSHAHSRRATLLLEKGVTVCSSEFARTQLEKFFRSRTVAPSKADSRQRKLPATYLSYLQWAREKHDLVKEVTDVGLPQEVHPCEVVTVSEFSRKWRRHRRQIAREKTAAIGRALGVDGSKEKENKGGAGGAVPDAQEGAASEKDEQGEGAKKGAGTGPPTGNPRSEVRVSSLLGSGGVPTILHRHAHHGP